MCPPVYQIGKTTDPPSPLFSIPFIRRPCITVHPLRAYSFVAIPFYNSDGSFTEAGPIQFSFRDANGNPLTNVTVTGASGFSYTATTLAVPEPASLALLAPTLLLALRRRARPAF
jgi:hypothetical protein